MVDIIGLDCLTLFTWIPPDDCRHGDYQRYRNYTTRRLQRLRKGNKFSHQFRGKTFTVKPVNLETIGGPGSLKKVSSSICCSSSSSSNNSDSNGIVVVVGAVLVVVIVVDDL